MPSWAVVHSRTRLVFVVHRLTPTRYVPLYGERMTIVLRVLTALVAAVAAVLVPAAALADPPERLATQVTDRAGALGAGRESADAALSRLRQDTGIQLFIVFVDSFDGASARRWTDETARLSDLGDDDALLAVATGDRAYAYSLPDDSRISDGERAAVARNDIEPALTRGDWSGAVVAAADGYRDAATGSNQSLSWVFVLLAVIIAGALIWVFVRRRLKPAHTLPSAASTSAEPAGPTTEELTVQANALLIELDDDLRASERELDLATAQYGTDATRQFRAALDAARENVAEAFRLRMTLDDVPAPDETTRRRSLSAIITNCTSADQRLDAESEDFDRLRDLEGRAAQVADEVDGRRVALEADLPATAAALQDLLSRYAGTTVTAVSANVDLARERLSFAMSAVAQARAALAEANAVSPESASTDALDPDRPGARAGGAASPGVDPPEGASTAKVPGGDRAEAALAVRAAEQALDQAEQLVAAVHRAGTDLAAAHHSADALIAEVEAEIAAGQTAMASPDAGTTAGTGGVLPGGGTMPPGLAAAVVDGEQALIEARTQLAEARPDPVAAVARLQAADSALDQALADARDAADRSARARSVLAQALPVARAEMAAASDFITTRRGAVDTGARASLSEAQRHLALAESLAIIDPATAVIEARQAQQFAANASQLAHADVQSWGGNGQNWNGSGYGRAGAGGFDAGAFAGAVLGGILAGGGRSHGGWSSGGSTGGWAGGGFGGSASRGRRTGGSGGGGARRGGGGRF
jgi:TPM domain